MNIKELASLDEFDAEVRSLEAPAADPTEYRSDLLYRGQANREWKLDTTLERFGGIDMGMVDYFRCISAVRPSIDAFTGRRHDIPTRDTYVDWLAKGIPHPKEFLAYEYFAYLRHHGFPSPLLDWSHSPYVAAYFAFAEKDPAASHVSIYAYREFAGMAKSFSSSKPYIHALGPYVDAHKRHFIQRSAYTVCMLKAEDKYASHEAAFTASDARDTEQDVLWRFDLPVSERTKVLAKLDLFNLNAFSLFATEESLMRTLAFRELEPQLLKAALNRKPA